MPTWRSSTTWSPWPEVPGYAWGGTFDIISFGGTEADGWTTIEFVRNMTTEDSKDKDIPDGDEAVTYRFATIEVRWASPAGTLTDDHLLLLLDILRAHFHDRILPPWRAPMPCCCMVITSTPM